MANKNTNWTISTDIYNIVDMINKTKARFIEDEEETTLAAGIFGFLGDTEAKKIQTAVVTTGELGNEMFPQRAKLERNLIAHAVNCNIMELNAVPSHMLLNLAIKETDLDVYMKDNEFVLDHLCDIDLGDLTYHLDYDVIIRRYKRPSSDKWTYVGRYDMDEKNTLSNIRNPYLDQPYIMNFNNYRYVFIRVLVRQVELEFPKGTMESASVIDNKSFTFNFENQLAAFDIYITENGKTTRLQPYIYGQPIDPEVTDYCWYLFVNSDTIRVGFDPKSYLPGLSAEVNITVYNTLGKEGNFVPKELTDEAGIYVDFTSERYSFNRITTIATMASSSLDGKNKKTMEELRKLVPKEAMSRGYITTETDLTNYFNYLSDETNRFMLKKKIDNNISRVWYCYLLVKDQYSNMIPSNTLPIQVDTDKDYCKKCDKGRFMIPCGTMFCYDPELDYAKPIDSTEVPELFSEEYFGDKYYYRSIYNIIINTDPLYCAYYLTILNRDSYFEYTWLNENLDVGFIANTYHLERKMLSEKDEYKLSFRLTQSVNDDDYKLYYEATNDEGENQMINNMRVVLVIYKEGEPYRYIDAVPEDFDGGIKQLLYTVTLKTDDTFDILNRIKLLDLYEAGFTTRNYGFFEDNCEAYIYIYGKFEDGEYGRGGKDKLIPEMEGYTLINIYRLADGLTLFENYTDITNTRIRRKVSVNKKIVNYSISGIPLIGAHYFTSEDNVKYLFNLIKEKREHIDYCLLVLENNMDIDLKFFNTYGLSKTFFIGDRERTGLGHIDITMKFRLKLENPSNVQIKTDIIDYIKSYVEDINALEVSDVKDLHFPNLLHDIKEEFGDTIIYIEYMNYNNNRLGLNHIELRPEVEIEGMHLPREFINVRNRLTEDGKLEPDIDVEIVI